MDNMNRQTEAEEYQAAAAAQPRYVEAAPRERSAEERIRELAAGGYITGCRLRNCLPGPGAACKRRVYGRFGMSYPAVSWLPLPPSESTADSITASAAARA